MTDALNPEIAWALGALAPDAPLRDGAAALLGALGYRSERTAEVGGVAGLLALLEEEKPLTARQRSLFDTWRSADIVFQVTGEEIGDHPCLFQDFDKGRAQSFLFVAADLDYRRCARDDRRYSRTELAEMTRVVNRGFPMPVIVLFRHGTTLTLAAIHRRTHRRDGDRDVLERVSLVKDIRTGNPHRAHVDILGELALPRLIGEGVRTFDDLHTAWERVLDIEALNRRFYRELFAWFQRAVAEARFPDDGAGEGSTERHVIRLITRLLFIWFLKEKGLATGELFEESFARQALRNFGGEPSDYYRAVLQNLFFATLNTEIDKRDFSQRTYATHRDFYKYRYRDLLADPDGFVERLRSVPFVNGGLFDCLDDFSSVTEGGRRIDMFSDPDPDDGARAAEARERAWRELHVPDALFLDDQGLFPLLTHYKFTVEENTPLDREVALDPELLGRVFENLLAAHNPETRETARKATGSYYTPRQVVDYMVREGLAEALAASSEPSDGDAEFWRERLLYLLDHSDAMDDADELFDQSDRRAVVAAIADLKALDPAVGSGAFPMGILQTLTLALRRIDPDNALWEEFQKERAKVRAGAAFDVPDQERRDDALREISDTFEKYRQSDFGRKLYLIQNSIYGVDVQPIACQIAKLRFFISLVIEQDPDPDAPNLGIKPLPNLETRFAAADTLLGLAAARVLTSARAKELEWELIRNRERHFHASTRREKLRCRAEDERLRESLAAELQSIGMPAGDADNVGKWDPYDQNRSADWFNPEYMFGIGDGFDVVIGNPPYIQLQKGQGTLARRYGDAGFETLARRGDVYQLFYERGCGLLRPDTGTLAYITSNSWLKAESGKGLRRWLAERHTPLRLIEMGKDVFDAIVDASVLLVREGGAASGLPAVDMDRVDEVVFPPAKKHWGEARPAGVALWSILSGVEWRILDKMRARGVPLKDWDVRINYGVKTGYNAAFIIDDATREALIAEDPRSDEIIKPILRGRDIRRFRAKWAGKWLIDTHNGYGSGPERVPPIDVGDFPAVQRHLDCFFPQLLRRQDKGRTPYNLRNCAYHEDFANEKLFWMDMSPEARFAFSEGVMYCNDKGFILTGSDLKYLCAVLNSSTVTWVVSNTALTTGEGLTQWKKFTVEDIPIPRIESREQQSFVRLVDIIIATKDADLDADTAAEEDEIDRLVYDLYGLNQQEIAAVRKATS